MFLRSQRARFQTPPNQGRNAIAPVLINSSGQSSAGHITPQLGQIHPHLPNRRERAHLSHITDSWEPRGPALVPLIEPLSRRHQVQMSYHLSPQLQQDLGAGRMATQNQGRVRKNFTALDPIHIATSVPAANPITGRSLARSRPPLL